MGNLWARVYVGEGDDAATPWEYFRGTAFMQMENFVHLSLLNKADTALSEENPLIDDIGEFTRGRIESVFYDE